MTSASAGPGGSRSSSGGNEDGRDAGDVTDKWIVFVDLRVGSTYYSLTVNI